MCGLPVSARLRSQQPQSCEHSTIKPETMRVSHSAAVFLTFLWAALKIWPALDEPVKFTDVTSAAGIRFVHNSGRAGKKWLPETMGAGCAFFDADGDGWPDILLINGKDWTPRGRRSTAALYRNNHDGTFSDITR